MASRGVNAHLSNVLSGELVKSQDSGINIHKTNYSLEKLCTFQHFSSFSILYTSENFTWPKLFNFPFTFLKNVYDSQIWTNSMA